jgi:uncharacterized protein (DUF1810 family)
MTALVPMADPDPFGLARFVEAQEGLYPQILAELRAGRKRTHWMWFVFPQAAGLGRSPTAIFYAIGSAAEGRAYLDHPTLGARLEECTRLMLGHAGTTAETILGEVDALKLRSSMTLFNALAGMPNPYAECLAAFFDGPDTATVALLESWRH